MDFCIYVKLKNFVMLKIEVIGNLGANAETKAQNGEIFVTLRVAATNKYTNKETGEIINNTTWVSCIWRGDHSRVTPFLTVGTKVFIRGDAVLKMYVGHDGQKHAGLNVRIQELELCGSKLDETIQGQAAAGQPGAGNQTATDQSATTEEEDAKLAF